MQNRPDEGEDRAPGAWTDRLRGAVREVVRLRVILSAQGVGMMSQVLMQGLVL